MNRALQARLEAETTRHEAAILAIAEARMDQFAIEWMRTRKSSVEVMFGMGSIAVKVDGEWFYDKPRIIQSLDRDIDEITDGHRITVPESRTIRR